SFSFPKEVRSSHEIEIISCHRFKSQLSAKKQAGVGLSRQFSVLIFSGDCNYSFNFSILVSFIASQRKACLFCHKRRCERGAQRQAYFSERVSVEAIEKSLPRRD